jgi:nucleoid-associated protein YgaU
MFSITSRYAGIPTAVHNGSVYVKRRFLPQPNELAQIGEHTVRPGERLDHIAGQEFGDAEQWWQIADANRAMDPDELTVEPGRRLRITLAAGVPAGATAFATPPIPGLPGGAAHG